MLIAAIQWACLKGYRSYNCVQIAESSKSCLYSADRDILFSVFLFLKIVLQASSAFNPVNYYKVYDLLYFAHSSNLVYIFGDTII